MTTVAPQVLDNLKKMVSDVSRQMSDMATQLARLSLRVSEVERQPPQGLQPPRTAQEFL